MRQEHWIEFCFGVIMLFLNGIFQLIERFIGIFLTNQKLGLNIHWVQTLGGLMQIKQIQLIKEKNLFNRFYNYHYFFKINVIILTYDRIYN